MAQPSLAKRLPQVKPKILASLLLVSIPVLSILWLYYNSNPFLEAFEAKSYDLRFKQWRGPVTPDSNIAIIAIDDKSIAELGRFPWSRMEYARLIDKLAAAGARVLLIDAFFPEPEGTRADRAFADALQRAGNVVLAVAYELDAEQRAIGSTHTLHEIEANAAGIAHINFLPDHDGINRRNLLIVDDGGKVVPSLGLAGAMAALGVKELAPGSFGILVGEREVPVDGNLAMWINYTGGPGSYPYYSFTDVVNGRIPPEQLKDKILFLGATALGIYDMRVTPFHGNTPGVEVHATVTDNIISGRFIRLSDSEAMADILAIVLLGVVTHLLMVSLRYYYAIPAVALLALGYLWTIHQAFAAGHWLSMIYPMSAIFLNVVTGGGFRYLVLERSAREMRSMFSTYLTPKLVARLEQEPELAKIGGDNKEITVLFTDIKGFTSFSEKHTPQEVVSRLNEYLDAMVHVIERYDGTIDKFIGDGIMIYWGAPIPQPDHAQLAIECVLAMQATMKELCAGWEREGVEPFSLRGGIQSGEVVAGNIGSRGRKMEYTVIGDTVNMAARLEGSAKYYGVEFLVGEETCRRTRDRFRYRELDTIRMVGKAIPVTVHELLGTLSAEPDPLAVRFGQALQLYRSRQWEAALQAFSALAIDYPKDQPVRIYCDRCQYFVTSPPPAQWDGVFNRLDK